MKLKSMLAAFAIVALTAACAQNGQYGNKQVIGGLGGAALGGWAGSTIGGGSGKLAATAAGVLIGALIGSEIGRGLDEVDKQKAERAYTQATTAPVGQSISWSNPDTGNYGTVTPTREGTKQATNEYCREFQQTVVIGGQQEQAYGVACRKPDGQWEVQ